MQKNFCKIISSTPIPLMFLFPVYLFFCVLQFFEYGSPDQRKELANQLTGKVLPLSLQMYGCRVIQKVCLCVYSLMLPCSIIMDPCLFFFDK